MPEKGKFLKGLAVIDDIAYVGVSVYSSRQGRDDPRQDSELAAFCLRGMMLLWRRTVSWIQDSNVQVVPPTCPSRPPSASYSGLQRLSVSTRPVKCDLMCCSCRHTGC